MSANNNRDEKGRLLPGHSIKGGRPKGSRHALAESFLSVLAKDFDEHGPSVVQKVRENDPSTYLRVTASILPKEFNVAVEHSARELNDAELADIALGSRDGANGSSEGPQEHNAVH